MSTGPIVVGLDGSEAAAEALRWAAWESQQTGAPVVAVHAYTAGETKLARSPEFRQVQESLVRAHATGWLREALATSPALPYHVRLEIAEGPAAEAIEGHARDASMVVIGKAAGDAVNETRTVAHRCATWLTCPVVTVPPVPAESPSELEPGNASASRGPGVRV